MLRSTGDFAQWNPFILGGIPVLAAGGAGDVFYPTFILRLLLPIDVAMTWSFLLHLLLAGLFTFGFVRALGFAFWPALFAGVAYMMSGQVASLVSPGHDGKMYVSALAPLLLWMIVRAVRDGRAWAWGMIALVTGLAILTPHNQMVYYLALLCHSFHDLDRAARERGTAVRGESQSAALLIAGAAAALGFGDRRAAVLSVLRVSGLCGARDGPRVRVRDVVLDAPGRNAEFLPPAFLGDPRGVLGPESSSSSTASMSGRSCC